MELKDKDLSFNYRTHCDPRLNYEQSLGKCQSGKGKGKGSAEKGCFSRRRRLPHLGPPQGEEAR